MSVLDWTSRVLGRSDVWAVGCALAGFLGLFWLIRGAPLGQATRGEPAEAPPARFRDRAVAASVVGFLLVMLGGYLAVRVGIPWSMPAFAVGFAIVLRVVKVVEPYRHDSPTMRRTLEFSRTAMTASLVGGILVVGNVTAFRYGGRPVDLTHDRAYSLESRTLNFLSTLDRPVTIAVFAGKAERSSRQVERVQQLLSLYKAANPAKVRLEFLNPFVDTVAFEAMVKRLPDLASAAGDGLVITYGEGEAAPHEVLGVRDLFEGARVESGGDRFLSSFGGEDIVTSSIIRLSNGKRSKIAFTTGHDEPSIAGNDPSQAGLGLWRGRLSSIGTDSVEVNLRRDEVPADATLLVICGPKSPFQVGEVDRILGFLRGGGPILVLLGNAEPTGLEDLLRRYNVDVMSGQAVEPRLNFRGMPNLAFVQVPTGATQPIVASIGGRSVLAQNAAPLDVLGVPASPGQPPASKKPSNPGVIAAGFLKTSSESWAETDFATRPLAFTPGTDKAGPIVVGVAVATRPAIETERPRPRMVVFSSPTIADNRILRLEPSNLDMLMNSVHWLRGRPELLGIASKTHESLTFVGDPGLQLRLVMVPTLVAVVLIVGLGVTTYLARRD